MLNVLSHREYYCKYFHKLEHEQIKDSVVLVCHLTMQCQIWQKLIKISSFCAFYTDYY